MKIYFKTITALLFLCLIMLIFNACENNESTNKNNFSSTDLFDPLKIVEVNIKMDPADWDFIRNQTRDLKNFLSGEDCLSQPFLSPFEYKTGSVTVNGIKLNNVGIRKKGFIGSLDNNKPSLKIKFDEYVKGQEILGLSRLTLNNNKSDHEHVRQCIAYQLFTKAGVKAPRCNFAHVIINGKNIGLFTHLDSIKKQFLARHFNDNDGRLFEGTLSDFDEDWVGTFEVKTNKDNTDKSNIYALISALELPDEQLETALSTLIDLDEFMKFWAIETLINHVDGYTSGRNNFYIYIDPQTGLMHFIPWGVDSTFIKSAKYGTSLIYANSILAQRLYLLPETQTKYIAAIKYILDNIWNEQEIINEINRMKALIAPFTEEDPFNLKEKDSSGKDSSDKNSEDKGSSGKDSSDKNSGDKIFTPVTIIDFVKAKRAEIEPVLIEPPVWDNSEFDNICQIEKINGETGDPQCKEGEIFEKNGVTYECLNGKWIEKD